MSNSYSYARFERYRDKQSGAIFPYRTQKTVKTVRIHVALLSTL